MFDRHLVRDFGLAALIAFPSTFPIAPGPRSDGSATAGRPAAAAFVNGPGQSASAEWISSARSRAG